MSSIIVLLGLASFIAVAVMTVTGSLLPVLAREFACTVGTAGIVVSAFVVPYGAFQLVFGPLGDRAGKLRVVAAALGGGSVFVLGSAFASSLEWLAAMRALSGAAMAGTVPLALAYLADEAPLGARQVAIGRYVNSLVLGQIAGGSLGGLIAQYFDWRVIFAGFAFAGFAVALGLWRAAARAPREQRTHRHSLVQTIAICRALFTRRVTRVVILAGTFEGIFIFGMSAYFGAFLVDYFGLNYAAIGLLLAIYGVGGLLFGATVHAIAPRLGERRMVVAGTLVLGLCFVSLPYLPHWWLCAPLFLLAGFAFYNFHNIMQTHSTGLSEDARGTAVAVWVFMVFLGQGAGVTVAGWIIDGTGYAPAFALAALGLAANGWWYARTILPLPRYV